MTFHFLYRLFRKDIENYMEKLLKSDLSIEGIINKLSKRYKKAEIVNYFRDVEGNKFIFMTPKGELFMHGTLLASYDAWLCTVLNLKIFSRAVDAYDSLFQKSWSKDAQLKYAETLVNNKDITQEQYLYLIEIISCMTEVYK